MAKRVPSLLEYHMEDASWMAQKELDAIISGRDELLEACEEFVRKVECGEAQSVRSYAQMKAAIAKAKGNE